MKKLAFFAILFCLATSVSFAQQAAMNSTVTTSTVTTSTVVSATQQVTITGTIVDNMCAKSQKPEELGSFVKTHSKSCAIMSDCAASGYSIFADGKLYGFDKASSAKVEEFLKKEESKLQVVVTAVKSGDQLSLVSIENQK